VRCEEKGAHTRHRWVLFPAENAIALGFFQPTKVHEHVIGAEL
jgi:hypothetical protein